MVSTLALTTVVIIRFFSDVVRDALLLSDELMRHTFSFESMYVVLNVAVRAQKGPQSSVLFVVQVPKCLLRVLRMQLD